ALGPTGEALCRVGGHDLAVRCDALSVERGLAEAALSQPEAALGKEQAVADQAAEEQANPRTLDEVSVPGDENLLDRVGVIHEERASRPESNRHEIAVLTRACGVEAELIASEVRAVSKQEVAFRTSSLCLSRDGHSCSRWPTVTGAIARRRGSTSFANRVMLCSVSACVR